IAECSGTHLLLCHGCDRAVAEKIPTGSVGAIAELNGEACNDKDQALGKLGGCGGGGSSALYSTDQSHPSRSFIPRSSSPSVSTISAARRRPGEISRDPKSSALASPSTAFPVAAPPAIHTIFPRHITPAADVIQPSSRITPLNQTPSRTQTHIPDTTLP